MPLFEEKLVSPLAIRFSQKRIRPTFQNGYPVEKTLAQIEMAASPPEVGYNVILDAPFPPIEIIRWRPKLREEDGKPIEDDSGSTLLGEECWFTFDNRRLYCLQRAAMSQWPRPVAAVVRVMYDVPTIRSAVRKFRTTTRGQSVTISRRDDVVPQACWDWTQEGCIKSTFMALPDHCRFALNKIADDARRSDRSELSDIPPNVLRLRNDIGQPTIMAQIHDSAVPEEALPDAGKVAGQALLAFVLQNQVVQSTFDCQTSNLVAASAVAETAAVKQPKIYQI